MEEPVINATQEREYLSPNEITLWKADRVGLTFKGILNDAFFAFINSLVVIIFVTFSFSFLMSLDSLILKFLVTLIILFLFFYFLIWLTQYQAILSVYITNNRIIIFQPRSRTFYTDFQDIALVESLNTKVGDFTKYRIKSIFYSKYFGKKYITFLKTYRSIYLDAKAIEIIKEKSPKATIKL